MLVLCWLSFGQMSVSMMADFSSFSSLFLMAKWNLRAYCVAILATSSLSVYPNAVWMVSNCPSFRRSFCQHCLMFLRVWHWRRMCIAMPYGAAQSPQG